MPSRLAGSQPLARLKIAELSVAGHCHHEGSWSPAMTSHNPKPTARNCRFYLARMQACQTEAQEASLPNVRDRALRAAVAWREMYQKALQFEQRQGQ